VYNSGSLLDELDARIIEDFDMPTLMPGEKIICALEVKCNFLRPSSRSKMSRKEHKGTGEDSRRSKSLPGTAARIAKS